MRRVPMSWRRGRAEAILLSSSDLPDGVVELIRHVADRARLWSGERLEVVEELVCHFVDGCSAGVAADELLADFGDADTTARMIGEAKRKQRPPLWHAVRYSGIAAVLLVGMALAAYLASAASLYLTQPAATHLTPETMKERIYADTDYHSSAVVKARYALRAGDVNGFVALLETAMAEAETLRSVGNMPADLLASRIETYAARSLTEAIEDGAIAAGDPRVTSLARSMQRPIELRGIRAAFYELVDHMYTRDQQGNGHLTSTGIEVLRQFKRWHEPSLTDRLMEPVWYVMPASRSDLVSRFEYLVGLAEKADAQDPQRTGLLAESLLEFRGSMMLCLRFPALSAMLPAITEALVATQEAALARRQAVMLVAADNSTTL